MSNPLRLAGLAAVVAVLVAGGLLFFGRMPSIGPAAPSPSSPIPSPTHSTSSSPNPSVATDEIQIGGGWLVFERGQSAAPGVAASPAIWAVRQDGSGLHEVAPEIDGKQAPDISPDGSRVAFEVAGRARETDGGMSRIWQAPIDGGPATVVDQDCPVGPPCSDTNPSYSPDGSRIAFVRNGDLIAFVDLGTGAVTQVGVTEVSSGPQPNGTPFVAQLGRPTWANHQRIAYQQVTQLGDAPQETSIVAVNTDNTDRQDFVPPDGVTVADPHWSPDGTRVLVSSETDRYNVTPASLALYTWSADGSEFKQLCAGGACGIDPSWSPDGKAILFWRDGSWWAMDPHSTNQRLINPVLNDLASAGDGAFVVRLQPDASTGAPLAPTPTPGASPVAFAAIENH